VVVEAPDEYTTHKGLEALTVGAGAVDAFTVWNGTPVVHRTNGQLAYFSGGSWTTVSGTYNAPSGGRVVFNATKQNLFFTTSAGVYRWESLTSTPVAAGLPSALPGSASLTAGTALSDDYTTAYRDVWILKTEQGRLLSGPPSPRVVISNEAGGARDVVRTVPIPDGLPDGALLQVYRADEVAITVPGGPTDEMGQVYEREPTTAERTAGAMTFTDNRPDTVKGSGAYFNPNTGSGLTAAKFSPPVSRIMTTMNGYTLYGRIAGRQRLSMALLGVSLGGDGLDLSQGLTLRRGGTEEAYLAGAAEAFPGTFRLFSASTPAQNLANTVDSLVRAINSRSSGLAYAFTGNDDGLSPGEFYIEARDLNGAAIEVEAIANAAAWTPRPRVKVGITTAVRAANVVTIDTGGLHYLRVGDEVELLNVYGVPSDATLFPPGVKTIASIPAANQFTYAEVGANGNNAGSFSFVAYDVLTTQDSTDDNAFALSEFEQPDSVPLGTYDVMGDADKEMLWAVQLGSTLFVGKEDGLFRLQIINGSATHRNIDNTIQFVGERMVAVAGGRGWALTTQGLVSWTENGGKPQVVSGRIDDQFTPLLSGALGEAVASVGFMVADDTAKRLYIFVPESSAATSATKAHVYSYDTDTFTRLTSTFPGLSSGVVAGLAPKEEGRLYLAPATTGLYRTRNAGTNADYQGPSGEGIPTRVQYTPQHAGAPEKSKQWSWTDIWLGPPAPSLINVGYATEITPTEGLTTVNKGDAYTDWSAVTEPVASVHVRYITGQEHMRAKTMYFAVQGSGVAQEPFRLFGWAVKARAYGP
jgi:hypothetical protein